MIGMLDSKIIISLKKRMKIKNFIFWQERLTNYKNNSSIFMVYLMAHFKTDYVQFNDLFNNKMSPKIDYWDGKRDKI